VHLHVLLSFFGLAMAAEPLIDSKNTAASAALANLVIFMLPSQRLFALRWSSNSVLS
jgi:hypothetical protein